MASAQGGVPTLTLDPGEASFELSDGIDYLIDEGGRLSLDELVAAESPGWADLKSAPRHLKSAASVIWLRFDLENPRAGESAWLLALEWPFFDTAELFVRDRDTGEWLEGDGGKIQRRIVSDYYPFVFALPRSLPRSMEAFMRIHPLAKAMAPLFIWRDDAFNRMTSRRNWQLGIAYGALAAMFLYNAILAIFLRDRNYLIYSAYIVSIIIYTSAMNGVGAAYLWKGNAWIQAHAYGLFSSGAFLMATLFIRRFLSLPEYGGWIRALADGAVNFWIVVCVLYIAIDAPWLMAIEDFGAFASGAIGLASSIYAWAKGNPSGKYLAIAWTALILATIFLMLGLVGAIDYSPSLLTVQMIGFCVEINLLSFALAARIRHVIREKDKARQLSLQFFKEANEARERELQAQERTLEVERAAKAELSEKVETRTMELSQAMKALEQANAELGLLSITDGLTGVANRRHFDEVFDSEFKRAARQRSPVSVVLADIDNFKKINDTYGHIAGDQVGQSYARRPCHGGESRSRSVSMRHPKDGFDRLVPAAIIALAVFSLAGASVVVKLRYDADLKMTQASIVDLGRRISENAGHELELREMSVQGMRLMGESFLSRHVAGVESVVDSLAVDSLAVEPGLSSYYLRESADEGKESIGNLTGYGPVPRKGSAASREAEMAIALTPLFRTLVAHNPDTPWVYYTSLSGFMYLYPRGEPDSFRMTSEILGMDFVRKAMPDVNPSGAVVWTPVYEDAAGKGRMVTVSAPVYEGGRMRGTISTDISIGELGWLLGFIEVPDSTLHIVDGEGALVISAGGEPPSGIDPGAGQATLVKSGGRWLTVFPLGTAGWSLVIDTDADAIVRATIVGILPLASMIIAFAGILSLLVALVRNLRRVETLSTKDPLTGLLNRRMFEERAAERQARARRGIGGYGLAIFDIDDFKKFNDALGHHEGDRALKEVARASIGSLLRATDHVFRIGGEEFALLVEAESDEGMEAAMAKLVEAVASLRIAHPRGTHGALTVSMGGIVVPAGSPMSVDAAYRLADGALYRAKAAGKNRAILDSGAEAGPADAAPR